MRHGNDVPDGAGNGLAVALREVRRHAARLSVTRVQAGDVEHVLPARLRAIRRGREPLAAARLAGADGRLRQRAGRRERRPRVRRPRHHGPHAPRRRVARIRPGRRRLAPAPPHNARAASTDVRLRLGFLRVLHEALARLGTGEPQLQDAQALVRHLGEEADEAEPRAGRADAAPLPAAPDRHRDPRRHSRPVGVRPFGQEDAQRRRPLRRLRGPRRCDVAALPQPGHARQRGTGSRGVKFQLEQLDLLQPWPRIELREGYRGIQVLVRIGAIPVGDVFARPVRRRQLTHRRLRKRIVRKLSYQILKVLAREGMAAGPEVLKQFPRGMETPYALATAHRVQIARYLERHVLDPRGLPAPFPQWIEAAKANERFECPPVTVAICTRDRPETLEGCIESLKRLDYPAMEILVVNNSRNPYPTEDLCERAGVTYINVSKAGLSRARNAAIAVATTPWIAFTDDDCRPEPNWLRELVRPLADTRCRAVAGL